MAVEPVRCPHCKRPYNPGFAKCPFCGKTRDPATGLLNDYPAIAEHVAQQHRAYLELDFSMASVCALDVFLDETYGTAGEAPDAGAWDAGPKGPVIMMLGVYFGEVLRRHFGGHWREDAEHPKNALKTALVLPGIEIFPAARVWERLKNGSRDGLESLVARIRTHVPQQLESPSPWLKQAAFFERASRPDLALVFYTKLHHLPLDLATRNLVEQKMRLATRATEASAARAAAGTGAATDEPAAAVSEPQTRGAALNDDSGASPADRLARAGALAEAGKVAEAVAEYQRLTETHPSLSEPWRELGVHHAVSGRLAEAHRAFDRAIAASPTDAVAWDYKAVTFGRENKDAEALAALEAGLSRNPSSADLHARRSFFLNKLGRAGDAKESAARALSLDPKNLPALLFRSAAEEALGDRAAAARSMREFLELAPRDARAARARQKLFALEHPGRVPDVEGAAAKREEALRLAKAGRSGDAMESMRSALEHDPTDVDLWLEYGDVFVSGERLEEALAVFERALQYAPAHPALLQRKAHALWLAGRFDDALACHDLVLARSPTDVMSLEERARLLLVAKRIEASLVATVELVKHHPSLARGHARLGHTLGLLGRHPQALLAYDRALELEPQNRHLWMEKASALAMAGRSDESFALQKAALSDPEFARQYEEEDEALFASLTKRSR